MIFGPQPEYGAKNYVVQTVQGVVKVAVSPHFKALKYYGSETKLQQALQRFVSDCEAGKIPSTSLGRK